MWTSVTIWKSLTSFHGLNIIIRVKSSKRSLILILGKTSLGLYWTQTCHFLIYPFRYFYFGFHHEADSENCFKLQHDWAFFFLPCTEMYRGEATPSSSNNSLWSMVWTVTSPSSNLSVMHYKYPYLFVCLLITVEGTARVMNKSHDPLHDSTETCSSVHTSVPCLYQRPQPNKTKLSSCIAFSLIHVSGKGQWNFENIVSS